MPVDREQRSPAQDAWVARYVAALERLGVPKPLSELETAGRALWHTTSHQRPEDLAPIEWRALFAGPVTCH